MNIFQTLVWEEFELHVFDFAPLWVKYVIMAMVAVPISFLLCMLVQGIDMNAIQPEEWKMVLLFFAKFEASCLFLLTLWLTWGISQTMKSLKQMNSARKEARKK